MKSSCKLVKQKPTVGRQIESGFGQRIFGIKNLNSCGLKNLIRFLF